MATEELVHHAGPGIKEFFTGVHLLIVVAIIYFAGRRGIMAMIKDRSRNIEKDIVDARVELEKMKHETEKARQEITQIAKTREKFIEEIKEEGQRLYDTLVTEAQQTSSRILADAKLAAENEVTSALNRVKEDVVNRAVEKAVQLATAGDARGQIHGKLFDRLSQDIGSIPNAGDVKNGL